VYKYKATGGGYDPDSSKDHCRGCCKAMREALEAIPVKWERVWIPVARDSGITLKLLREWEHETHKGSAAPNMRRVAPGLVNDEGVFQVVHIVQGKDGYKGRTFQYAYWPGKEDEAEITERVARNVETGQTEPWKVGRHGWRPYVTPEGVETVQVGPKTFLVEELPDGALPEYGGSRNETAGTHRNDDEEGFW
jgi:hypothetical protein